MQYDQNGHGPKVGAACRFCFEHFLVAPMHKKGVALLDWVYTLKLCIPLIMIRNGLINNPQLWTYFCMLTPSLLL